MGDKFIVDQRPITFMQRGARISWIRALHQPVTYLGLGMTAFIVAGLAYLIHKDQQDAYNAAVRTGTNLAQVFEGYMARSFKSADNTLRALRSVYQQDPEHFDIAAWAREAEARNELTIHFTVIGADGKIKSSTSTNIIDGIDLNDREHFQKQVEADSDEVFISKPLSLRTKSRTAIVLSRRIVNPDGSFAGVVSGALDPANLQKFYDALDLGTESTASLVGFDGVIRVRGGGSPEFREKIGAQVANVGVMARYKNSPTGTYWNDGGRIDSVRRLVTYRVVEGYPLIALVGLAKSEIYKYSEQNARIYYTIAGGLMLIIFCVAILAAVRERKLASTSHSLSRANEMFETALVNLPHGLCVYDGQQRLMVWNEQYWKLYGMTSERARVGMSLRDVFRARIESGIIDFDFDEYVARSKKVATLKQGCSFVENLSDGRIISIVLGPLPDGGWVAIQQDITAQKRAEADITHLAHYDALTSLVNRVLFLRHINEAMARCHADGSTFAVHILDLDRFKEVNDTLGHACGDQLLRLVAQRLLSVIGKNDIVARLGGDEFAILQQLDGETDVCAVSLAERVLTVFADPFDLNEHRINVETSIGIALAPENGEEAEQLLKTADLALYKAKSEGRNTYRLFKAEMELEAHRRHALQVDLRNAIAANEFELHYQPIVDARTQEVCGVEALLRWHHPLRGLVPPDKFIPLAEETGLIVPLGEWVLRRACFDAATLPEHLTMSVNLSSVQFRKSNLHRLVDNALRDSGLSPERLELEVTETVLLQNNEENTEALHKLRKMGVSIALDDFGIGYSSLSYLQSFPFDRIKIDRSFVANLTSRADCAAIVSAVTSLARSLDIKTTAEGVETEEQMMLLRAAGCSQMQGYLFGRPRPKSSLDFRARVQNSAVA
jgi:diguanylate cyclase (GGDEF)-like protein